MTKPASIQLQWTFFICLFLSFAFPLLSKPSSPSDTGLIFNLIGEFNGKGLETDLKVLQEALEQKGCCVRLIASKEAQKRQADINIFFEFLIEEKFYWAKQNWFIPNPDWFRQKIELLDQIDLVLCRTRECERIFQQILDRTFFLGFTSPDCYMPQIDKNFCHLFHLAGGSQLKGTASIREVWLSNPAFPLLTIVDFCNSFNKLPKNMNLIRYRLDEEELRKLQNLSGIHLAPSETEGFGHSLMEAMSCGAVVVTTDAPPMNEFIEDARCLVPYFKTSTQMLATKYFVDPEQLQNKIETLINLSSEELISIGLKNRSAYLKRKNEFYENLEELIWIALGAV